MRIDEVAVRRLAGTIVDLLTETGQARLKVPRQVVVEQVAELILANLREEQKLEEEAARLAERYAGEMQGLDERRVIQGIKERLARQRGFQL